MHDKARMSVDQAPSIPELPEKIAIRGLSKTFRSRDMEITALDSFDLRVGDGEFICIVGPSGCGKTTLLRILAGLNCRRRALSISHDGIIRGR
jgi:NitT/TauT family transport system ATP-binding protein